MLIFSHFFRFDCTVLEGFGSFFGISCLWFIRGYRLFQLILRRVNVSKNRHAPRQCPVARLVVVVVVVVLVVVHVDCEYTNETGKLSWFVCFVERSKELD